MIDFKMQKRRFVAFQSKQIKLIGLILLSALIFGCKPSHKANKTESSETRVSRPQHFKKTNDEPENFNREVHVIRELWKALSALDPAKEEDAKKYALIQDSLRKRLVTIEPSLDSLSQADQDLIKKIQATVNP